MNSDKSATKSGLVGRYLTVLDLKTSCRALSASVRWYKTICRGSRVPQPMRNCHESHVNKRLFQHMAEIDLAPSLNSVSHDKKSASVRQADIPTNLSPTKNLQLCDKKSASVRRPLARSVDARSFNSPQVKKFLQVYHCSGDQGSTKVIIFYAILVC